MSVTLPNKSPNVEYDLCIFLPMTLFLMMRTQHSCVSLGMCCGTALCNMCVQQLYSIVSPQIGLDVSIAIKDDRAFSEGHEQINANMTAESSSTGKGQKVKDHACRLTQPGERNATESYITLAPKRY